MKPTEQVSVGAVVMLLGLIVAGVVSLIILLSNAQGTAAQLSDSLGAQVSGGVASHCTRQGKTDHWTCSVAFSTGSKTIYAVTLKNNCFLGKPTPARPHVPDVRGCI